jgi:chaperonin GroES
MKKTVKKLAPKPMAQIGNSSNTFATNTPAVRPLRDRVLIRLMDMDENTTSFGLIIPDTVDKEKSDRGIVVAVGDGWYTSMGEIITLKVKVGDRVIFSKYSYEELKQDGKDFYILKEENILAILN